MTVSAVDEGMVSIGGVRYREDELAAFGLSRPEQAPQAGHPKPGDSGAKQDTGRANKGRHVNNKAA